MNLKVEDLIHNYQAFFSDSLQDAVKDEAREALQKFKKQASKHSLMKSFSAGFENLVQNTVIFFSLSVYVWINQQSVSSSMEDVLKSIVLVYWGCSCLR